MIFDKNIIVLYGENHQGKSSVLNAIEWCLFGNKVAVVKEILINERMDWAIQNRKIDSAEVTLEMVNNQKKRVIINRKSSSPRKEDVKITIAGVPVSGGDTAAVLDRILGLTLRDFMSMVYQHQENIRAIMTQQPKERNEAIDRLLGLSDYRNLNKAINISKIVDLSTTLNNKLQSVEQQVSFLISTKAGEIKEKSDKVNALGFNKDVVDENYLIDFCKNIDQNVRKLMAENEIDLALPPVPADINAVKVYPFAIKDNLIKLKTQMPVNAKLTELTVKSTEAGQLSSEYDTLKKQNYLAIAEKNDFILKNGDEEEFLKKISGFEKIKAEKDIVIEQTNARAEAINKSIVALKNTGDKDICPVCGKKTEGLIIKLQQELDKISGDEIKKLMVEKQVAQTGLNDLRNKITELKRLSEVSNMAIEKLDSFSTKIEKLTCKPLNKNDDPGAIMANFVKEKAKEIEAYTKQAEGKLNNLNKAESEADKISTLLDLINVKNSLEIANKVQADPLFIEMQKQINEASQLGDDYEAISSAISEISHGISENEIGKAKSSISSYFQRITTTNSIEKIELSVKQNSDGANEYELKDSDGQLLMPILSQGDLNGLALSMFLGMVNLSNGKGVDFILLDDPSQSMAEGHKENLVAILNEISEKKMVIVATMDQEFMEKLKNNITKTKQIFMFDNWSPTTGPNIEELH